MHAFNKFYGYTNMSSQTDLAGRKGSVKSGRVFQQFETISLKIPNQFHNCYDLFSSCCLCHLG